MTAATAAAASSRRADTLRKVRGLIDTAVSFDSAGNHAAADSYRAKADELMLRYAIETFEIDQARDADTPRLEVPEVRVFERTDEDYEVRKLSGSMFDALAKAARCKVAAHTWTEIRVVGYPTDLDYLDMMFTSLRLDLASKFAPGIVPGDYAASLGALRLAGRNWFEAYKTLRDHFPDKFTDCHEPCNAHAVGYYARQERTYAGSEADCAECQAGRWAGSLPYRAKSRMSKTYATWCKATGTEQVRDAPAVWARSFSYGYTAEVRRRLMEMTKTATDAVGDAMALVLAGREEALDDLLYEEAPHLRPHPEDCECDSHHYARCKVRATCGRSICVDMRKPVRGGGGSFRQTVYSAGAMQAGRRAGATADLTGRGRRVSTTTKGAIG